MAKTKTTAYFCQSCGFESAKWMGQCPACHAWNTFVEEPVPAVASSGRSGKGPTAGVVQWNTLGIEKKDASGKAPGASVSRKGFERALPLKEISVSGADRMSTGIQELDRVLGSGLVPGSLVLVGGDPGIGKSTLLLQVCRNLTSGPAPGGVRVLYVSGEESQQQIKLRAISCRELLQRLKHIFYQNNWPGLSFGNTLCEAACRSLLKCSTYKIRSVNMFAPKCRKQVARCESPRINHNFPDWDIFRNIPSQGAPAELSRTFDSHVFHFIALKSYH